MSQKIFYNAYLGLIWINTINIIIFILIFIKLPIMSLVTYNKVLKTIYEEDGPSLVVVKCKAESTPLIFPHSFDGVTAINRFKDTM